jgi:hypothetical protein
LQGPIYATQASQQQALLGFNLTGANSYLGGDLRTQMASQLHMQQQQLGNFLQTQNAMAPGIAAAGINNLAMGMGLVGAGLQPGMSGLQAATHDVMGGYDAANMGNAPGHQSRGSRRPQTNSGMSANSGGIDQMDASNSTQQANSGSQVTKTGNQRGT